MKTYGRVKMQVHSFVTSAVDEGEWPPSDPGRCSHEQTPPVLLNRRLVGLASKHCASSLWRVAQALCPLCRLGPYSWQSTLLFFRKYTDDYWLYCWCWRYWPSDMEPVTVQVMHLLMSLRVPSTAASSLTGGGVGIFCLGLPSVLAGLTDSADPVFVCSSLLPVTGSH
jgi:hypothetical protein